MRVVAGPLQRRAATRCVALPPTTRVRELRSLIEATRGRVAQTVNSELVALYWQVGKRLREEFLGDERAVPVIPQGVVGGEGRRHELEYRERHTAGGRDHARSSLAGWEAGPDSAGGCR